MIQAPAPSSGDPPPTAAPRRHVVFIGETGSGKSSVINLIAGQQHDPGPAVVSPDVRPCTRDVAHYDVAIEGRTYRLWDTPGLNQASVIDRLFRRRTAVGSVRQFLQERHRLGQLDLLVFCVKGNRASDAMTRTYNAFCVPTRRVAPVVIAVTHLERQQPTMDTWWQSNERTLGKLGLTFDGYACLTCLSPHHRRWASRQDICNLVSAPYPSPSRAGSPGKYLPDNDCVIC